MLGEMIDCGREFERASRSGRRYPFANMVNAMREIHRGTHRPYPCGAGAGYLGVSADGELAACHRFVGDEEGAMGSLDQGVDLSRQADWLAARHVHRQEPCRSCWARYLCGGGCHHEVIRRGRPACDYIRGWLHYCLEAYLRLSVRVRERQDSASQERPMADVCVIGAGPAGSIFAARMAQLGHHVHLIERQRFPRRHLGESLSPGVMTLLRAADMHETVEAAGFPSGEAASGSNGRMNRSCATTPVQRVCWSTAASLICACWIARGRWGCEVHQPAIVRRQIWDGAQMAPGHRSRRHLAASRRRFRGGCGRTAQRGAAPSNEDRRLHSGGLRLLARGTLPIAAAYRGGRRTAGIGACRCPTEPTIPWYLSIPSGSGPRRARRSRSAFWG